MMKKILPVIVVGVVIFSGIAITTAESDGDIKEEKVVYQFSNLNIETINNNILIKLDGTNELYSKENYYRIPYREETLTFPLGTKIIDITYKIGNTYKQKLTGKLEVTPKPTILGTNIADKENKEKPLNIDKWLYYDTGGGIDGNNRCIILKLELFPIQYQPDKDTIEWTKKIKITIKYKPPETQTLTTNNDEQYTLIILTPTEFKNQLQPLVNHKISRGITTKLVTLDEIYYGTYFPPQGGDNQEKIKYFIKNAIEQWSTTNVLLVGGVDYFPLRYSHVVVEFVSGAQGLTPASDLYYADIYDEDGNFQTWDPNNNGIYGEYNWNGETDEIDLYPDVNIGRLACTSVDEVNVVVNKISNYETNEAYKEE
ncbi:MAG TPA: hypothetical protein ENI44_05540, partial [Thermoplasmatales archaeon]|nr:hypothetical protein [Thermoplasmatales archaeon]